MSFLDSVRSAHGKIPRTAFLALAATSLLATVDAIASAADRWSLAVAIGMLTISLGGAIRLFLAHRHAERVLDRIEFQETEKASRLACDEITDALLRRFFLEACEARIARRKVDEVLAYFAVDMDFLKILNDSLGHEAGDAALRHLVLEIKRRHPDLLIGRLGGDEFAFLMPCAGAEEAEAVAGALLADIGRPVGFGGRSLSLSATIGITLVPTQTAFLSEAVQFSDLALYEGKKAGRARCTLFTRKMLGDFRHDRLIERELRVGLDRSEFELSYQPIADASGRTFAVRSVLSWQSGWLGHVPTSTFLRVAEASILIDKIGEWTMERACRDAPSFGDIKICVPVSSYQLKRDDIVKVVGRLLTETGIEPARLIIEIGGPDILAVNADARRRLAELRRLGILVSLSDFRPIFGDRDGLDAFPADIVRIASSFIRNLGANEADNVIVSALAMLAGTMSLSIIAEGIETEEQLLLARAAGCQFFTGSYVAAPMPGLDLSTRLESEAA